MHRYTIIPIHPVHTFVCIASGRDTSITYVFVCGYVGRDQYILGSVLISLERITLTTVNQVKADGILFIESFLRL